MRDRPFSAYLLLYGDFYDLHDAILTDLQHRAPPQMDLTVWCNQVCARTLARLSKVKCTVVESKDNVPKYPAMRWMFKKGVRHDWILWLDDDTRIMAEDWWAKTAPLLGRKDAYYVGQCWTCGDVANRAAFIQSSSWYRGKPPALIKNRPGVEFAIGGYWWLRKSIQQLIDWPDPRLRHCGGDTLLAEAVRQQGLPFTHFAYGIKVQQKVSRRGLSEQPAGMNGYIPPPTVIDESRLKISVFG